MPSQSDTFQIFDFSSLTSGNNGQFNTLTLPSLSDALKCEVGARCEPFDLRSVIARGLTTNRYNRTPLIAQNNTRVKTDSEHAGEREVKKVLRKALFKYRLHKESDLFDRVYDLYMSVLLVRYQFSVGQTTTISTVVRLL